MPTESWGRIKGREKETKILHWRKDAMSLRQWQGPVLSHGLGRSYGDSCLVDGGTLIRTDQLNKFRHFDPESGRLSCEAGVSIDDLLKFAIPRGWFLPVTPGTKFVTMGGAIANDVHGKNHRSRGTIGCHILDLELMRSNGEHLQCSRMIEEALFRATIGGLGLTGIILSCTVQLMPIESVWIGAESIKTACLEETLELDTESDREFEYCASWIDCMAKDKHRGRGTLIRGNHIKDGEIRRDYKRSSGPLLTLPFDAPDFTLNRLSSKILNFATYHKQAVRKKAASHSFDSFFYPLDAIGNWNRMYGKKGLLQYQCVIPLGSGKELTTLFETVASCRQGSLLAVLKRFGNLRSPGLMSFPKEGHTISFDFRNVGKVTDDLFLELDKIVLKAGGRLYPAKDARMSAATFQASYPQWLEFERFVDPLFRSMFWERVSARGKS